MKHFARLVLNRFVRPFVLLAYGFTLTAALALVFRVQIGLSQTIALPTVCMCVLCVWVGGMCVRVGVYVCVGVCENSACPQFISYELIVCLIPPPPISSCMPGLVPQPVLR